MMRVSVSPLLFWTQAPLSLRKQEPILKTGVNYRFCSIFLPQRLAGTRFDSLVVKIALVTKSDFR